MADFLFEQPSIMRKILVLVVFLIFVEGKFHFLYYLFFSPSNKYPFSTDEISNRGDINPKAQVV